MPDINGSVSVSYRELVKLILREAGVKDGKWWLTLNFDLTGGNFGPSPEQSLPGAVVRVTGINIVREKPGETAPPGLAVDAAELAKLN